MPGQPLSPRDGVEVLDRALALSLRHYWTLLRLPLIPFLLYALFLRIYARTALPFALRTSARFIAFGFGGVSLGIVVLGAWEAAHGREVNVAAILTKLIRQGPGVFAASLLKVLGIFAGALLFLLPGLYLAVAWFIVPGVNLIEEVGVVAGFRRSRDLAGGSFGGVICSVGLVYLIAGLVQQGLSLGAHAIGVRSGTLPLVSAAFALHYLMLPIEGATGALVYLELRIRREGYDLQTMLAALPELAASTPDPSRTPPSA